MATRQESPEKDMWWVNELESLGVTVKALNELNNVQETSGLVENIKQIFYDTYKSAYSNNHTKNIEMTLT